MKDLDKRQRRGDPFWKTVQVMESYGYSPESIEGICRQSMTEILLYHLLEEGPQREGNPGDHHSYSRYPP